MKISGEYHVIPSADLERIKLAEFRRGLAASLCMSREQAAEAATRTDGPLAVSITLAGPPLVDKETVAKLVEQILEFQKRGGSVAMEPSTSHFL